jgi:lipid-A-disaccharide synthase
MTVHSNKIFVVAGEQSGDFNAANLIRKLKRLNADVSVKGIGGDYLKSEGAELIYNYSKVNFVGFSDVIKNYFDIRKIFNSCVKFLKSYESDVVLLVDFPGFNLKFAKEIKNFFKGRIVYYISPQIWAWHKSRINVIKNFTDTMLVVFPFEVEFYEKEGMRVYYAGNPLLENIDGFLKTAVKEKKSNPVITLMPGSRDEEFRRIFPGIANAVTELKRKFEAELILVHSKNILLNDYKDTIDKLGINIFTPANDYDKYGILYNSDLVITKFGTSSTECAFLGTPFISVYKANLINYYIAKKLVSVGFATMINIIAGKEIVKEFIQKDFTKDNILLEAERILCDIPYRDRMKEEFGNIKKSFYETEIKIPPEQIINEYLSRL